MQSVNNYCRSATLAEHNAAQELCKALAFSRQIETYISNPRRSGHEGTTATANDRTTVRAIRRVAAHSSARCAKIRRTERTHKEADVWRRVRAREGESESNGHNMPCALLTLKTQDSAEFAERPLFIDDEALAHYCRFVDAYPLAPYAGFVQHVPRIVNVVTLSDVAPIEGTTTTLPLNLAHIATHCVGAYFAPRRFAAVQLAMHKTPRARVLIFLNPAVTLTTSTDTGRIVGTGTTGPTSARLAVMQAIQRLAKEADIHLRVTSFGVKNIVGAVTLGATINCEAFAQTHTDTAHYDRSSFVGMTWRPRDAPVCAEVYSTGRVNVPGGKSIHDVLVGFARLVPELLEFSSSGGVSGTRTSSIDDDKVDNKVDNVDALEHEVEYDLSRAHNIELDCTADLLDGWGEADALI